MDAILLAVIFFVVGFITGATRERVLTNKGNAELGVLTGKDAERFLKEMKENENKKVSPEESERIKKNYEIMKSIIVKASLPK